MFSVHLSAKQQVTVWCCPAMSLFSETPKMPQLTTNSLAKLYSKSKNENY